MLKENVRRTAIILCLFMAVLLMIGMLSITVAATSDTVAVVTNAAGTVAETVEENKGGSFWSIFAIIFTAIVAVVVSNYISYKKEKKLKRYYDSSYSNLLRENQALRNLKKATSIELCNAQSRISALEDWRNRAIENVPELKNIVQLSYAKDQAEAYLKKYYHLDGARPTYNNYNQFESAIADYHCLNEDVQQQVVGIDINRFKQKRNQALLDYIATVKSRLEQTDAHLPGNPREDFMILSRVLEWYENLPDVVKSEIPCNVITSIKMKKANAEYNMEIIMASDDDDEDTDNGHGINQLLDSFVSGSSKLFGKATSWVKHKVNESKQLLNDPFDESYYDDDDDDDDDKPDGDDSSNDDDKSHQDTATTILTSTDSTEEYSSKKVINHSVEPGETYTL